MSEAAPASAGRGLWRSQPAGLATLFFTELWERFSYYGMRALLTLFMIAPAAEGGLGLGIVETAQIYGNYTMAVYMLSIPGGFVADAFFGARRALLIGGGVIAVGHFALAVPSVTTFYAGLVLIALGTGLFKPSISALVGGLYAAGDQRRDAGFSIFYMGINIGALISPLLTGFLAQSDLFKSWLVLWGLDPAKSWHWGFASAGVGMTAALLVFVLRAGDLGRMRDAPRGVDRAALARLGMVVVGTIVLLVLTLLSDRKGLEWLRYLFIALPVVAIILLALQPGAVAHRLAAVFVFFIAAMVFFAVFEQAGLTIAFFGDAQTRSEAFGVKFPSAWYQSLNSFFVIALTPLFVWMWLRLGPRQPSAPVKFALGLTFLAAAFLLMVPASSFTADGRVSPLWIVGLFFLFTVGELLLSPVGLSTMTKLAPERMVALTLGIWFLAAAWGNKLAGILGGAFDASNADKLASFFFWQAIWVLAAAAAMFALTPWIKKLMSGAE